MTVENNTTIEGAYVRSITVAGKYTHQVEISAESAEKAVDALLKYEMAEDNDPAREA